MSTSRQVASPARQLDLYREYISRWGLTDGGDWSDPATSATDNAPDERPGWMALVAAARRKPARFDLVWVEERSRLARRPEDWFAARAALGRCGVAIVTLADDPRAEHHTAIAEFRDGLFALLARYKVAEMGEALSRAQGVLVRQGNYRGGYLPPGLAWHWDDREARRGHYVLHEESAPLARRCYEVYAETHSYQQTARTLSAEGYLSRPGNPLSQPAVRSLLRNSVYRGGRRWGDEVYPTALPQIVPAELVAQVDLVLAAQYERPQRATHTHTERAVFAGLLVCPECGGWLQVHYSDPGRPSGKVYLSYKCHRSRTLPITCSWRRLVPELSLERAILPELAWRARRELQESADEPEEQAPQRHRQRQRERLQRERQQVLTQHRRQWITDAEAEQQLAAIDAQLAAEEGTEGSQQPQFSAVEVEDFISSLQSAWPVLTPADKRLLLQSMVARIVPDADDLAESEIEWVRHV